MIKLAVFDLDDTLAPTAKGVPPRALTLLRRIEERGVPIAICSGKPTFYLCGFARQLELKNPILVGENGAVIQFGVDLPPKKYCTMPFSEKARQSIRYLREQIDRVIPDMWYQPNEVVLTPFPARQEDFSVIDSILEQAGDRIGDVDIYRHWDCFDFVPSNLDKGTGLRFLGEQMGIAVEEMAAVGNASNDYPMFAVAGCRIGVNVPDQQRVDVNFGTVEEAMEYLLARMEEA